jgi:hypothetical protein
MFNRRNFLKNFGIGGAVLSSPSVLANDQSTNTEFVTIKGTVSANGKGIPQVSVTDGYTVVRTDNNGKYQIKAHSQAEFVYISVPSGYEFPNEKGVARFYQKIDTTKSTFQANFTINLYLLTIPNTNLWYGLTLRLFLKKMLKNFKSRAKIWLNW